jgi:hypothetical protein
MLAEFRKKFHSKDSKTNTTIIAILFVIAMVLPQLKEITFSSNWLLAVNGNKISINQFRDRYAKEHQIIEYYKQMFGKQIDLSQFMNTDPVSAAQESLVHDALANEVAAKINLEINPEVIKNKIIEMLPTGKTLAEIAKQQGVKIADIEAQIRQDIVNKTVSSLALGGLYIPEFLLKKNYLEQYAKKKFEILVLKANQTKNSPNDNEAIAKFYEEMKNELYVKPETRQGVIIEFEPNKATIGIADVELEGYYNQHKNQFIKSKPQVAVRLFSGEKEALAKLVSGDIKALDKYAQENPTKVKELARFARGTHNQELEKQAFALQEKDELSPVFNDGKEDLVVQLVERFPTSYKSIAEVKSDLKKAVTLEKLVQALTDFKPNEAAQLIKDFGGFEKSINVTSAMESSSANRLFDMQPGEIRTLENQNQLVRLDKVIPQFVEQLNDIKQKVASDYYKLQAQAELQKNAAALLQEAQNENFGSLAKKYNAELVSTEFMVNGDKEWEKLIEKLSPQKENTKIVASLRVMNKTGETILVLDGNAFIIKLTEIQASQEDYLSKIELIRSELLKNFVPALEHGFIASLKRNAKIKINEKFNSKK